MATIATTRQVWFILLLVFSGAAERRPNEPSFVGTIANMTVNLGSDATLSCEIQNLGSYKMAWVRGETQSLIAIQDILITNNPRLSLSHEDNSIFRLHWKNVEESDLGSYKCQIIKGLMISQTGYLQLAAPPDLHESPWSKDLEVREGVNVTLECRTFGDPPPTVTWRKKDPSENQNYLVVGEGEKLHMVNVSRLDMGAYQCVDSNGHQPSVSRRTHLKVEFPPMISLPKQLQGAMLGGQITLECNSEAYPSSLDYWTNHRGEIIFNDLAKYVTGTRQDSYKTRMRLTILNLTAEDFTTYHCAAKNSLGEAKRSIKLYDAAKRWPSDPSFVGTIGNNTVTLGSDAVLSCHVKNLGYYKVAWVKVETQTILTIHNVVISRSHRVGVSYEDQSMYRLHLKDVVESDRGFYMCEINTDPMINQMGYLQIMGSFIKGSGAGANPALPYDLTFPPFSLLAIVALYLVQQANRAYFG